MEDGHPIIISTTLGLVKATIYDDRVSFTTEVPLTVNKVQVNATGGFKLHGNDLEPDTKGYGHWGAWGTRVGTAQNASDAALTKIMKEVKAALEKHFRAHPDVLHSGKEIAIQGKIDEVKRTISTLEDKLAVARRELTALESQLRRG